MTLRNPTGPLAQEHVNANGDAHLVSGSRKRWRREFNNADLSGSWNVVTGAGMAVGVAGGALTITTGTTPNAETIVTSKDSFTCPFRAQWGVLLSSKIANVEVYVEMVAETSDGSSVDETVVAAWRIAGSDSTSATNARTEVRNGGGARSQSANISGQTSQTAAPGASYEIVLEADEVRFYSKTTDSASARSAGAMRNSISPDPNRKYRLRYRIKNGAVAPASSVTFTSTHAVCIDYTEQQVEVSGGNGSVNADQSIPVYQTNVPATTALAGSATTTGTTIAKVLAAAGVNNTLVKNAAGRLYGYYLANTSAQWRYVKFYNKATAPVAGTDTPVMTLAIPPGGVAAIDRSVPVAFATGIGYAITGAAADNDTTAVVANDVVGVMLYV